MGLDVPNLDDRNFDSLVEDSTKRIPVYSEEWTNHNAHDPGITILELLAWITESDIYRLNRLGDAHVRKYLQLMGAEATPVPPTPASTRLLLDPPDVLDGTRISVGESLVVDDGSASPKRFETTAPITLTTAQIATIMTEHSRGRVDNTNANRTEGIYFHPFGEEARRGSTTYLGFDGDPFGAADVLQIAVEYHEDDLPAPASHGDEASTFEPSVSVTWEHCTNYDEWYRNDVWIEVHISEDGTNDTEDTTDDLYRGGSITLERPSEWIEEPAAILDEDRALFWLRATVEEPGYEVPPQLDTIALNVVEAEHRARVVELTPLERADGATATSARPGQTFVFDEQPILSARLLVGGTKWQQVEHFDASGPDDRHYVLDRSRGEVRFGDNVRGSVPAAGQSVVAEAYTCGGGTAGNVQPSASWRFERPELGGPNGSAGLGVEPLVPPAGGTDAESVEAALIRLQRDRRTPYRAVAPADYRAVATSTPGLRFGRAATVVDREDPLEDCEPHNTVRVVVVPFSKLDRPIPSRGFLRAVERHLEEHRLLTDRIAVEPPTYVGISVSAEIELRSGYSEQGRSSAVTSALNEFLHPLRGFDGDGWPFGRPVYPSELYETIEGVEGVECARALSIAASGTFETDPDGTVLIGDGSEGRPLSLVYPKSHQIAVAPDRTDCGGT
ncbi:putative baseplate assembly protein [Halalkalicoccus ordinarius]|uniref:putative baseplate assembly protein n=1 Tax=Halalkalicoccus ordinarius TaxID=3116651 RepID=UPI00300F4702